MKCTVSVKGIVCQLYSVSNVQCLSNVQHQSNVLCQSQSLSLFFLESCNNKKQDLFFRKWNQKAYLCERNDDNVHASYLFSFGSVLSLLTVQYLPEDQNSLN